MISLIYLQFLLIINTNCIVVQNTVPIHDYKYGYPVGYSYKDPSKLNLQEDPLADNASLISSPRQKNNESKFTKRIIPADYMHSKSQNKWITLLVNIKKDLANSYHHKHQKKKPQKHVKHKNKKTSKFKQTFQITDFEHIWVNMLYFIYKILDDKSALKENTQSFNTLKNIFKLLRKTRKFPKKKPSVCPYSYDKAGSLCLSSEFTTEPLTWHEARKYCQLIQGGDLVVFRDACEFEEVLQYLVGIDPKYHENYWVGATDLEHEGVWRYINKRMVPLKPPFWGKVLGYLEPSGHPESDPEKENYGMMVGLDFFHLHDVSEEGGLKLNGVPLCQYLPERDHKKKGNKNGTPYLSYLDWTKFKNASYENSFKEYSAHYHIHTNLWGLYHPNYYTSTDWNDENQSNTYEGIQVNQELLNEHELHQLSNLIHEFIKHKINYENQILDTIKSHSEFEIQNSSQLHEQLSNKGYVHETLKNSVILNDETKKEDDQRNPQNNYFYKEKHEQNLRDGYINHQGYKNQDESVQFIGDYINEDSHEPQRKHELGKLSDLIHEFLRQRNISEENGPSIGNYRNKDTVEKQKQFYYEQEPNEHLVHTESEVLFKNNQTQNNYENNSQKHKIYQESPPKNWEHRFKDDDEYSSYREYEKFIDDDDKHLPNHELLKSQNHGHQSFHNYHRHKLQNDEYRESQNQQVKKDSGLYSESSITKENFDYQEQKIRENPGISTSSGNKGALYQDVMEKYFLVYNDPFLNPMDTFNDTVQKTIAKYPTKIYNIHTSVIDENKQEQSLIREISRTSNEEIHEQNMNMNPSNDDEIKLNDDLPNSREAIDDVMNFFSHKNIHRFREYVENDTNFNHSHSTHHQNHFDLHLQKFLKYGYYEHSHGDHHQHFSISPPHDSYQAVTDNETKEFDMDEFVRNFDGKLNTN